MGKTVELACTTEDGVPCLSFSALIPQFYKINKIHTNTADMGGKMRMGYHAWVFLHKYHWYGGQFRPKSPFCLTGLNLCCRKVKLAKRGWISSSEEVSLGKRKIDTSGSWMLITLKKRRLCFKTGTRKKREDVLKNGEKVKIFLRVITN